MPAPEGSGAGSSREKARGREAEGSTGGTRRLFIGVPLPEELLPRVAEAQAGLEGQEGIRLIRPEQLHVTLAFLGHVGEAAQAAAEEVVAAVPAELGGTALLEGYLALPSARRARVVTLEIEDPRGVFTGLFERVMGGLEAAEVMRREARPYRPHLTIARLRKPGPVQLRSDGGRDVYPVGSVCLYESKLRRSGAEYTVLRRRQLEISADGDV